MITEEVRLRVLCRVAEVSVLPCLPICGDPWGPDVEESLFRAEQQCPGG